MYFCNFLSKIKGKGKVNIITKQNPKLANSARVWGQLTWKLKYWKERDSLRASKSLCLGAFSMFQGEEGSFPGAPEEP